VKAVVAICESLAGPDTDTRSLLMDELESNEYYTLPLYQTEGKELKFSASLPRDVCH
jgi:hypothetical protein